MPANSTANRIERHDVAGLPRVRVATTSSYAYAERYGRESLGAASLGAETERGMERESGVTLFGAEIRR